MRAYIRSLFNHARERMESYIVYLCCRIGYHNWDSWVEYKVLHTSNPSAKQRWSHHCIAYRKFCRLCGKNSSLRFGYPSCLDVVEEEDRIL